MKAIKESIVKLKPLAERAGVEYRKVHTAFFEGRAGHLTDEQRKTLIELGKEEFEEFVKFLNVK